ncbi:MAG: hypothetical protein O7H41_09740 [Planctomycetota bacterium]|nr:hypothetical protein [Planctomycetota bacterium]
MQIQYKASFLIFCAVAVGLLLPFSGAQAEENDRTRMIDEWTRDQVAARDRAKGELSLAQAELEKFRGMALHLAGRREEDRSVSALAADIEGLRAEAKKEAIKAVTGLISAGLSDVADQFEGAEEVIRAIKMAGGTPDKIRDVLMGEDGDEIIHALEQAADSFVEGYADKDLVPGAKVALDGLRLAALLAKDLKAGEAMDAIWEKRGDDLKTLAVDALVAGTKTGAKTTVKALAGWAKVAIPAAGAAGQWYVAHKLEKQLEHNKGSYDLAMGGVQKRIMDLEIAIRRQQERMRKAERAIEGFEAMRERIQARGHQAYPAIPLLPGEGTNTVDVRPTGTFAESLAAGPKLESGETTLDNIGSGIAAVGGGFVWVGSGIVAVGKGVGSGVVWLGGTIASGLGSIVQVGGEATGRRRFISEAAERQRRVASRMASQRTSSSSGRSSSSPTKGTAYRQLEGIAGGGSWD